MAQMIQLQNSDETLRRMVETCRNQNEECVIQDNQNRPVAVMMPIERYESYQAYLKQKEKNFAILDTVAEDLKNDKPDFIERQIENAVQEVKAEANSIAC